MAKPGQRRWICSLNSVAFCLDSGVHFSSHLVNIQARVSGFLDKQVYTEGAVVKEGQVLFLMDATIEAGEMRLRPIIMTSLAFIFGVLPLAIAVGPGANARHSIGTGIIGGMICEATLAMLYVPLFYYIFDRWSERSMEKKERFLSADEKTPNHHLHE